MSIEGIVYCFENLVNGKKYVGQTRTSSAKERFRAHWAGTSNTKPFNRAMKKYGTEAFMFRILEDGIPTQEALDDLEIFWIKEMNSQVPNGYNVTAGGGGMYGYHHTDDAKQRISAALSNRKWSDESRQKLSNSRKGMKFTEEHRNNIRKVVLGTKRPESVCLKLRESRPEKKAVRCVETGEQFVSMAEAARQVGCKPPNIVFAVKNRTLCKGYHWMLQNDFENNVEFIPHINIENKGNRKVVRCIETGIEYRSTKEAALAVSNGKYQEGNFSRAIKSGKTCLGYHWEYVEKSPPLGDENMNETAPE